MTRNYQSSWGDEAIGLILEYHQCKGRPNEENTEESESMVVDKVDTQDQAPPIIVQTQEEDDDNTSLGEEDDDVEATQAFPRPPVLATQQSPQEQAALSEDETPMDVYEVDMQEAGDVDNQADKPSGTDLTVGEDADVCGTKHQSAEKDAAETLAGIAETGQDGSTADGNVADTPEAANGVPRGFATPGTREDDAVEDSMDQPTQMLPDYSEAAESVKEESMTNSAYQEDKQGEMESDSDALLDDDVDNESDALVEDSSPQKPKASGRIEDTAATVDSKPTKNETGKSISILRDEQQEPVAAAQVDETMSDSSSITEIDEPDSGNVQKDNGAIIAAGGSPQKGVSMAADGAAAVPADDSSHASSITEPPSSPLKGLVTVSTSRESKNDQEPSSQSKTLHSQTEETKKTVAEPSTEQQDTSAPDASLEPDHPRRELPPSTSEPPVPLPDVSSSRPEETSGAPDVSPGGNQLDRTESIDGADKVEPPASGHAAEADEAQAENATSETPLQDSKPVDHRESTDGAGKAGADDSGTKATKATAEGELELVTNVDRRNSMTGVEARETSSEMTEPAKTAEETDAKMGTKPSSTSGASPGMKPEDLSSCLVAAETLKAAQVARTEDEDETGATGATAAKSPDLAADEGDTIAEERSPRDTRSDDADQPTPEQSTTDQGTEEGDLKTSTPAPGRKRERATYSLRGSSRKRARTGDQSTGTEPIRVLFTGVDVTARHKKMLKTIHAELLEDIKDAAKATHVVAGDDNASLRRTPKLMIGICRTSKIVHMNWLIQSAKAREAISTSDFLLLNDKKAEEKYEFTMQESLQRGEGLRRNDQFLLSGYWVYVCSGVAGDKAPPEDELQLIVDAAGGKWLSSLSPRNIRDVDASKMLIVTKEKAGKKKAKSTEARDVDKAVKRGAKTCHASWLFRCIIRQSLSD